MLASAARLMGRAGRYRAPNHGSLFRHCGGRSGSCPKCSSRHSRSMSCFARASSRSKLSVSCSISDSTCAMSLSARRIPRSSDSSSACQRIRMSRSTTQRTFDLGRTRCIRDVPQPGCGDPGIRMKSAAARVSPIHVSDRANRAELRGTPSELKRAQQQAKGLQMRHSQSSPGESMSKYVPRP